MLGLGGAKKVADAGLGASAAPFAGEKCCCSVVKVGRGGGSIDVDEFVTMDPDEGGRRFVD